MIGTKDVDDATNTRIVISGNSRASPYNGNIDYVATSGHHIFYTGGTNERMRISNNGTLTVSGTINLNNTNTINGLLTLKNDTWHNSADSIIRMYYANNSTTFICSGGTATDNGFVVYSSLASGGYNINLVIKIMVIQL